MIKPYYEESGIRIFNCDCREVLAELEPACAVVTDPPYNANKDYGVASDSLPEDEYASFMKEVAEKCLALAERQAWVAPRYKMHLFTGIFPKAHIVVVRRGASGPYRGGFSDQFETVLITGKPKKVVPDLWDDIRLKGEGYFFRENTFGHPGYTPSAIMRRCCDILATHSVIDPFSGTGTTLRMAKDLGLKAVGVEINEAYCEIAANRLRQEVLNFG